MVDLSFSVLKRLQSEKKTEIGHPEDKIRSMWSLMFRGMERPYSLLC